MENIFEQQVKDELKSMDQRLYDLEEKMTSIDTKLTQVVEAIIGNPITKSGGFVTDIEVLKDKLHKLETKVEAQEEFKKKISWTIGIAIAIAISIQYLINIYSTVQK